MSSKRFNNTNEDCAGFSDADFEEIIQLSDMAVPGKINIQIVIDNILFCLKNILKKTAPLALKC